jgi:hypothetical protein
VTALAKLAYRLYQQSRLRELDRFATARSKNTNRRDNREADLRDAKRYYAQARSPKPYGYGLFFCVHDRPYFMPCRNCRRGTKAAQREAQNALRRIAVWEYDWT